MIAKFLKQLDGWLGDARLYECEPMFPNPIDENPQRATRHVVVSAVVVHFSYGGPETYIFAADENGVVSDFRELNGSFKGSLDHEQALRNAGYEIVVSNELD